MPRRGVCSGPFAPLGAGRSRVAPSIPHRIGVDENGLGPRLGPLVVTGVLARVTEAGAARAGRAARGNLAERLGDSKALVAHGNVALGEAWARAIAARAGAAPATPGELFATLTHEGLAVLQRPCPRHVSPQCWGEAGEAFETSDAEVATAARDLDRLAGQGIDVRAARTSVTCTERLNLARAAGLSRFDVDLHAMESLVLALAERAGTEVEAICGKVGGYTKYGPAFGPLAGRLHAVEQEHKALSSYRFPGLGVLSFAQDADANDLLVAMASLVGKWVRELLMARIVRFYGARADGTPHAASGYHDPVTSAFVDATLVTRQAREVPDGCFERAAAAPTRKR